MEVICPSGLRGEVRRFKVRDERIITDARLGRSGRLITELLNAVWERTDDPGPYGGHVAAGGKLNWAKVSCADRYHALIQTRITTHGPEYEFQVPCRESGCQTPILHTVDLGALPCRAMAEEMRAGISSGEWCTTTLTDGRSIRFRPLLGEDEQWLAAIERDRPHETTTMAFVRRIVAIESVPDHPGKILEAVQDLDESEAGRLRDYIEGLEGGYDTGVMVTCERCGDTRQVLLPFGLGFFSRRKRSLGHATEASG